MGFQYQPLHTNEIRLLKFLSRSADVLSFEMSHVSLSSRPRYAALSYTWGLPGDAERIMLNGHAFPTRRNLHDALRRIQGSGLVEQYLWVDAICINQGDVEDAWNERSAQITLMKQIYEQTAKIIVWLGRPEDEGNNRLAFSMMRILGKRFHQVLEKDRLYRLRCCQNEPRALSEDLADFMLTISPAEDRQVYDVPGSPTYRAWLGTISLWNNPWWSRTWVFQESTIPEGPKEGPLKLFRMDSSNVRFLCGDQETSWHELATTRLVAHKMLMTPGINTPFLVGSMSSFDRLSHFRSRRILHILPSFLDILQMFRHTECFDLRDKVYAPLCLASDDVRRYIIPDYASKTVLDVYTDVVQYSLAQPGHHLDFLGFTLYQEEAQIVETPQGVKSIFPSWVPNFAADLVIYPIPKILYIPEILDRKLLTFKDKRGVPNGRETLTVVYRPLGDVPSRSFIEGNTLRVSGVCIDILQDIVPNTGPDREAVLAVAREKGRQWAIESQHEYFTGERYADAINRTAVLDVIHDDTGRPSGRGGKLDSAFLRRPPAELGIQEYWSQMKMMAARTWASTSRDLAMSQKRYLLMVPNSAVVGDEIWALAGGQALYILRPLDRPMSQFRFIGECYAHGLMDGEIERRLHLGEAMMEQISLL